MANDQPQTVHRGRRARHLANKNTLGELDASKRTVFYSSRPSRGTADPSLVGLLASEPPQPGLLVAPTATMALESGVALLLGYSGGDRPGIAPGSLFVGIFSRKRQPPTHT